MDDFGASNYPMSLQGDAPTTKMARMPTMKERLALAVKQAEERLAAAKRAKEIFDEHPYIEELLDLMQRSHF